MSVAGRMVVLAAIVGLMAPTLSAQWARYPTPGVPRLPDGKPNLTAPAPRTADGKPDLSGLWRGFGAGGPGGTAAPPPGGPPVAGFRDVAQNIKEGLPLTPEGQRNPEGARRGQQQGQPRGALPADGHRAAAHAGRAAQVHPDAARAGDPLRGQLGAARDLHRRPRPPHRRPAALVQRLLRRPLGRRHAGGRDGAVQGRRLAGHHRQPAAAMPAR